MAVIICVQDRMHAEFTIEFARRGFHVLCEKPLGVDVQECIAVAEEVEKARIAFALGHSTQETRLEFKFTTDSERIFPGFLLCYPASNAHLVNETCQPVMSTWSQ